MPYIGKQPANVPVTADDIPNDSITSAKILDNVITISDIGPNAVGNSEMADDAIGLNELSATGTTNSSTFLRGDNTWAVTPDSTSASDLTSGTLPIARIADDAVTAAKLANSINTDIATGVTGNTTANAALPKAGGTMTGDIIFADGEGISLGAGVDLTLLSDGSTVKFQGDDMRFRSKDGTETYFDLAKNAGINLRYDNATRIQTTSAGATVTGALAVTGTVDGVDIQTLNTTAGAALPKAGGTMTAGLVLNASGSASLLHVKKLAADSPMYMDVYSANQGHVNTLQFRTSKQNTIGNTHTIGGTYQGRIEWYGSTASAFVRSGYIAMVQGSSTETDGDLTINAGGHIAIDAGGSERLRIDSSGNVGIGTSSPDTGVKLHVQESDAGLPTIAVASALLIERAGNVGMSLGTANTGDATIFFGDTDSSTVGRLNYDNNDNSMQIWTNNAERMRINSSGNVGIGDTAPSQKLNVAGNIMLEGSDNYAYLTNVGTGNSGIYVRGITASSTLRSHSTGIFTWEVTGNEKMRIDSSGNVGIGTSSPLSPLDVAFNTAGSRRLLLNYDDSMITLKGSNQSSNPESVRVVADTFRVNTGTTGSGTEQFHITNTGKVGIKNTSPQNSLEVGTNAQKHGISLRGGPNGNAVAVELVDGKTGGFSSVTVDIQYSGAGGYGYQIHVFGTAGSFYQSGGGYTNSTANFSHNSSQTNGSGWTVSSPSSNLLRVVKSTVGTHPGIWIKAYQGLSVGLDQDNITVTWA